MHGRRPIVRAAESGKREALVKQKLGALCSVFVHLGPLAADAHSAHWLLHRYFRLMRRVDSGQSRALSSTTALTSLPLSDVKIQ